MVKHLLSIVKLKSFCYVIQLIFNMDGSLYSIAKHFNFSCLSLRKAKLSHLLLWSNDILYTLKNDQVRVLKLATSEHTKPQAPPVCTPF